MGGDLATMKARIARELRRSDLTTQIGDAITDAIRVYQKQRFRFSESIPTAPVTFMTVPGQAVYDVATQANIKTLFAFDYVLMLVGGVEWPLGRWQPEQLRYYNSGNTMQGQPSWYAYEGNELMLAPVPTNAWQVTIGGHFRVPEPQDDAEKDNPWMTDAERLIRARAKYEIAVHVTRNPTMAVAMSPDPPALNGGTTGAAYREWKALKGEANRVTGTGRIRPVQF